MPTHLVWFRADLRVHDNIALAAACRDKDANVLALFMATPEQWRQHDMAPRQAALLRAYLTDLQHSLAGKGIPLLYKEVGDFAAQLQTVQEICKQHKVTHLFFTTISTNSTSSSATVSWRRCWKGWSAKGLMTA